MTTVVEVPTKLIAFVWPHVKDFLQTVIDSEGEDADITIDQMKDGLLRGELNLLTYVNNGVLVGALAMRYQFNRSGKVAFVIAVGGKDISSLDVWDQIKAIFKNNGAVSSEAYMRPSRFRLWKKYGYETKYHVATVTL